MKFTTYVAIAATLFAVASAVTLTQYTDAACKTVTATSDASPNPFVGNLATCTKYGTSGYVKMSACAAGKYVGAMYSNTDDKCAAAAVMALTGDTDTCKVETGGSSMVTCASTSSVTMAFLAVAAAVLALSF
jgi:hypothetical protein